MTEESTEATTRERTPLLDWVAVGAAAVIVLIAIAGLLPEVPW